MLHTKITLTPYVLIENYFKEGMINVWKFISSSAVTPRKHMYSFMKKNCTAQVTKTNSITEQKPDVTTGMNK